MGGQCNLQFLSWFPSFILIIARTREHAEDDEQASSSLSSPSSTTSPLTPDDSRAPSAEPATKESEDTSKEPASGPQRTRSSSVQSNGKGADSKEKRKRSRVTPEQLVHLEPSLPWTAALLPHDVRKSAKAWVCRSGKHKSGSRIGASSHLHLISVSY